MTKSIRTEKLNMSENETHLLILSSLTDLKKSMEDLKNQITEIDNKGQHNAIEIAIIKERIKTLDDRLDQSSKWHEGHFETFRKLWVKIYLMMGGVAVISFLLPIVVKAVTK